MKKGKTMLESAHDLALAFNGLGESIEKAVIPVVKKLSDALNKVKKKK